MYWSNYDICLSDFEDECLVEEASARRSRVDPSRRSRLIASLLVVVLGVAGVHRLYLGKTDTALSMLVLVVPSALARWYPLGWLFLTVLAVWVTIDSVKVLSGHMQDGEGKPVKNWR
jgi:TM2 domain-containing membrane protein YozV